LAGEEEKKRWDVVFKVLEIEWRCGRLRPSTMAMRWGVDAMERNA
jgi:hypothetical protein